ncbi:MAG: hypothetical protein AB7P03_05075 [Kofleriaceae bacterium]
MSPEAASGLEVDHRADLFATGIVLWELLAGRRLFLGDTDYRTVELVREARVPAIDVDPKLDGIVRKALARDVDERFQTATAFGDALVEYARGFRLEADETGKLARDVKFEVDYERSAKAINGEQLVQVQDEVRRMISIAERDETPGTWN